ncbi:alpha-keto acid decarboxylase family protein [Photobacterium sp. BZF1]|uniref:alpha-keto acid decarboxylase family protein n=1 Tax=Photobacterium sp. BZF1 TaxID=1904457 RepID=UPI0016536F33|nr:thiamine pyrophosphate-binding protein [Photobacterium sp. BZF1]MBC7002762.1 alpha-keto acid decarboxylase family protein [Photobacterium sp. BZF1]
MLISVADYLVKKLNELNIDDFFGLPGDFNFNICTAIEGNKNTRWIGCSNELNAGYAADGYARIRGYGAVVTTFGVGELSAANAIAGCYSENVPVFHIVGSPATSVQNAKRLSHHTFGDGDFSHFEKAHAHLVGAHTRLTAENAVSEIDRLIEIAVKTKKPVYINLSADVCLQPVVFPANHSDEPTPRVASTQSVEAVHHALKLIESAKKPIVIGDAKAIRFGLAEEFLALVESLNVPVTTLNMGKSLIDETHPNFIGTYVGSLINPETKKIVEESDLIISVGALMCDQNTAGYTFELDPTITIDIQPEHSTFGGVSYYIEAKDFISQLSSSVQKRQGNIQQVPSSIGMPADSDENICGDNMYQHLQQFIEPNDIVVCETGSIAFGLMECKLPKGVDLLGQNLWMSIGWATPAAFGASIAAKNRRVILLTGDGSHQLTTQEIGQMSRFGCNTIVFLLNNAGYTIERYLADDMDDPFNDIATWNYTYLPKAFGANNAMVRQVKTTLELSEALKMARKNTNELSYIEAITFPHDAPRNLRVVREGRDAIYNAD